MIRNNKHIQELADECAQKNGYFCASYLGRKGDVFIYAPTEKTSEIRCTDLPPVITIKDNQVSFVTGMQSIEILEGLKFRDYKKGRLIFREYERKLMEDAFASDEERDYVSEIVHNQHPGYDVPVSKTELYNFLEIADRLGMKLELKPYEWCKRRNDGWAYYVELVEK